jgi:hypothetical protein
MGRSRTTGNERLTEQRQRAMRASLNEVAAASVRTHTLLSVRNKQIEFILTQSDCSGKVVARVYQNAGLS